MLRKSLLISAAPFLALFGVPAYAQDSTTSNKEASPSLAPIVVTAQKREQALQDVPISIAALGTEQLENQQINDLLDIVGDVPNVFINNFNGRPGVVRLFIRGLGQNDVSLTQDPSVALYTDGVYVGTSVGAAFELTDLERIEILRGPQGTLYGRNSTGGAINLISAKPKLEEFGYKVSGSVGNFDYRNLTGHVNIPLGETAALKFSGLRTKRDGWIENTGVGEDFSTQDRQGFRGALRWQPNSRLTADYSFDWSLSKDSQSLTQPVAGASGGFTPVGAPFALPGTGGLIQVVPGLSGFFTNPSPFNEKRPKSVASAQPNLENDVSSYGHNLTLDYELNESLSLRSITGIRRLDSEIYSDNLPTGVAGIFLRVVQGSPFIPTLPVGTTIPTSACGANPADLLAGCSAISQSTEVTKFDNWSQEFQLIGSSDSFLGGKLEYVAGGYYYSDDASQATLNAFSLGPRDVAYTEIENETIALFAEGNWKPGGFDDRLTLTLGGRWSQDKRKAFRVNENSFAFAALGGFTATNCATFATTFAALGQTCVPTGSIQGADYDKKFDKFSPSGSIAYELTDDVNVYGRIATGYKTGGTSQRSANPTNFAVGFEPEEVLSYELGTKGSLLDGRLAFNAAVFLMEFDKYQASLQTGSTPGDRDFVGIDKNEIKGFEGDITFAATQNLTLNASLGILDTQIGADQGVTLNQTGGTIITPFTERFSYAPEVTYTLGMNYERTLVDGLDFGFNVNYAHQSEMETSSNLPDNALLQSRGILDAGVMLTKRDAGGLGDMKVRVWGKNLTDEEYFTVHYTSFAAFGSSRVAEFGEPRMYGITLSFEH